MELREKIKAMRESKGMIQEDLAKASGVSIQSIKRYETKTNSNITLDNLQKIANALDTNIEFFVSQCLPMSPNHKNDVSQLDSKIPHLPIQKPTTIQIPVYDDVYASAGQGLLNEEYITRHIDMQKDFLRDYFGVANFLGLSIITARGDSMSPTIPENCQLLIQQSDSFQEGQICVVRLDNELYVKRLQKRPKYKLISDNKNYEDIELENEDYEILGVVVGFFKRMI